MANNSTKKGNQLLLYIGWILFIIGIIVLIYNTSSVYFQFNEKPTSILAAPYFYEALNVLALNRLTGILISIAGIISIIGSTDKNA